MENAIKKEERKVEYSELIYDLIFVYIIGRNNSLLHDVSGGFVAPAMFLAYILCTLAVIQIWNYSTYYINIYVSALFYGRGHAGALAGVQSTKPCGMGGDTDKYRHAVSYRV